MDGGAACAPRSPHAARRCWSSPAARRRSAFSKRSRRSGSTGRASRSRSPTSAGSPDDSPALQRQAGARGAAAQPRRRRRSSPRSPTSRLSESQELAAASARLASLPLARRSRRARHGRRRPHRVLVSRAPRSGGGDGLRRARARRADPGARRPRAAADPHRPASSCAPARSRLQIEGPGQDERRSAKALRGRPGRGHADPRRAARRSRPADDLRGPARLGRVRPAYAFTNGHPPLSSGRNASSALMVETRSKTSHSDFDSAGDFAR